MELSPKLKAHLLHLGIESVTMQDNRVQGYILKDGVKYCTLTNREVELIIRTWKCCEGKLLEHECTDEMQKVFYVEFQGFFTEWKQGNSIPPKGDVNALIKRIGTMEARRILSKSVGYSLIVYEGKLSFTRQELLQVLRELN